MNKKESKIENADLAPALKAVSKKWECDFCHESFNKQKPAVKHVKEKHLEQ